MRVTIGLPYFNNRHTLLDAVRSVMAQTYDNWELILCDDGSTDGSLEIARSIQDPRVRIVADGRNLGLASRLNQLASLAKGELLARMDGDDLMHPDRLMQQVDYFDKHPRTHIVGTGYFTITPSNQPVGIGGCDALVANPQKALRHSLYCHPTVMARTSWWQENLYPEHNRRAEDYELWCRTLVERRTVYGKIPEALFYLRQEGSATLAKVLASHRDHRRVLREYGPSLIGKWQTRVLISKHYLKSAAWQVAEFTGMQRSLIKARNRKISFAEQKLAEEGLSRIFDTSVPLRSSHSAAA